MERIKILVPAGEPKGIGQFAHCKVVDADTGEVLGPVRDVCLKFPFESGALGVITAKIEVVVSEIETVPADREKDVFPMYIMDMNRGRRKTDHRLPTTGYQK